MKPYYQRSFGLHLFREFFLIISVPLPKQVCSCLGAFKFTQRFKPIIYYRPSQQSKVVS